MWRKTPPSLLEHLNLKEIKIEKNKSGEYKVRIIDRVKSGTRPKSVWIGSKYDASSHGTKLLKKMFDTDLFSFPKSIHSVYDSLFITTKENLNALVLDFFAGTGRTGQHCALMMTD